MTERNAVRQYIQRAGSGVTKVGLAATLALSMTPALAIAKEAGNENAQEAAALTATNNDATASEASKDAQTSSSSEQYNTNGVRAQSNDVQAQSNTSYDLAKIADGTYMGTAVASEPEGEEWGVSSYTVEVEVKVSSHAITSVKVADKTYDSLDVDNADYLDKAENGKRNAKGVAAQIVEKNATNVDVVSNATVSSNAIIEAVDNALQAAYDEQNPVVDEYTYGYAGLTWAEYWAAEGVQAADSTETSSVLDSRGEADKGAFDVVTRATSNHGLHRGSFQCMATIKCTDGTEFQLATWADDGKSFTTTDGKTVEWSKGSMTCDGQSYTMDHYEVTGLKYVPVKVKTSDLEAFKAQYSFVANGETIQGGFTEKVLSSYSDVVADVDADTNGLKEASLSGDSFSFGKAATGTDSGIKDQALKSVTNVTPAVVRTSEADTENADTFHTGSYGEFLRVDINGDGYGDLGANMQAVTWTYYGNDSTRTNALATFGTKFAADNWMHKSTGIQLGLTESARCQLPADTDGTGYWTITVRALGYADASYDFEATASNIADHTLVTDATKAELQKLVDKANDTLNNINEELYTEKSVSDLKTELAETVEMLAKSNLEESEAAEQKTHLSEAIEGLTLAPVTEETAQKLNDLISKAEELTESDYSNVSWQTLMFYLGQAKQHAASADLTEQDARSQINVLEIAIDGLEANPRIALNEAIEAASALQQDNFTKASWEPFASALAAAQAAAADSDMSDDEISLAYQALVDAQDALAKAATADDRSCLADEIAKADSLKESDYTAESWKAYQEALAAAKKAAAAEDPSSAELQEATDNLAAARAALAKPAAEASTASNDQVKATTLAQTSDAAATFAVATGFAAFVAAVAGAFAIARRRLFNK